MAEEFKRLKRELKHAGNIINFYQDTVEVPNGNIVKWDFIGHKGAAAVIPVLPNGDILLVRQYRNAIDRYTWEIPAGGRNILKNGEIESYLSCAHRELEEETGYKTDIDKLEYLVSLKMAIAYCEEQIDVYIADSLESSKQNLDEDEFINVEAFKLDDIETKIYSGEIQDAKTIAAIMSYKNKRQL